MSKRVTSIDFDNNNASFSGTAKVSVQPKDIDSVVSASFGGTAETNVQPEDIDSVVNASFGGTASVNVQPKEVDIDCYNNSVIKEKLFFELHDDDEIVYFYTTEKTPILATLSGIVYNEGVAIQFFQEIDDEKFQITCLGASTKWIENIARFEKSLCVKWNKSPFVDHFLVVSYKFENGS